MVWSKTGLERGRMRCTFEANASYEGIEELTKNCCNQELCCDKCGYEECHEGCDLWDINETCRGCEFQN